jgi:hypothetical protein
MNTLKQLENQLESLYMEMASTFFEVKQRDKSAFLIRREIEKIKDSKSYNENKNHWEGHELRF